MIERYVDEDDELYDGHKYAYAILMLADDTTTSLTGGVAYRTSDGQFYSSSSVTHTWDSSKDLTCTDGIGYKYRWFIVYGDTQTIRLANNSVPAKTLWFVGAKETKIDLKNSGWNITGLVGYNSYIMAAEANFIANGSYQHFRNDTALQYVNSITYPANTTTAYASFYGTSSLAFAKLINSLNSQNIGSCKQVVFEGVGDSFLEISNELAASIVYLGNITHMTANVSMRFNSLNVLPRVMQNTTTNTGFGMLQNCTNLLYGPDELYVPSLTANANYILQDCTKLRNLPRRFSCGMSKSFASNTGFCMPETLAEFDENGDIIEGLAYGITACTNSQTITLNSVMKGYFTEEQQSKIETAFSEKNWSLSW